MALSLAMGSLLGGGISALGSLIGGGVSAKGQREANASNERIAKENRAFQERMSSTAVQRSAKDFSAAGLNRILAMGSPASSPGGSTAIMQNPRAAMGEGIQSATATAANMAQQIATIKKIEADTAFTESKTDVIAPAAELGESAGAAVSWAKSKLTTGIDYASLGRELMDELQGQGHTAKAIQKKYNSVMESIRAWYNDPRYRSGKSSKIPNIPIGGHK